MVSLLTWPALPGVPPGGQPKLARPTGDVTPAPAANPFGVVWILLLWQTAALVVQVLAMCMARHGATSLAPVVSAGAIGLTFASALRVLTDEPLSRAARNAAVRVPRGGDGHAVAGIRPTAVHRFGRATSPAHVARYSVVPQPISAASTARSQLALPRSRGSNTVFHQLGLPVMVAAVATVLAARVALVLALCDAVEHLTGSPRAGGLAVAAYSVSAQFIFFNSQFAYQTLALPLALAAVAFIARARWADNPGPLLLRRHCLSACRRREPSRHQLPHRGFPGCLGCCAARKTREATGLLWRAYRNGHDEFVGDGSVVAASGVFGSDRR